MFHIRVQHACAREQHACAREQHSHAVQDLVMRGPYRAQRISCQGEEQSRQRSVSPAREKSSQDSAAYLLPRRRAVNTAQRISCHGEEQSRQSATHLLPGRRAVKTERSVPPAREKSSQDSSAYLLPGRRAVKTERRAPSTAAAQSTMSSEVRNFLIRPREIYADFFMHLVYNNDT